MLLNLRRNSQYNPALLLQVRSRQTGIAATATSYNKFIAIAANGKAKILNGCGEDESRKLVKR